MDQQIGAISSTDYSSILKFHGKSYVKVGYYWQVDEPKLTQGWIIHLSVIAAQLPNLLDLVVPLLISKKLPFKIPRDLPIAGNLLEGRLGHKNLAKLICIYPETDQIANKLAKELITLLYDFKGPQIPTDRHLGSIVYTRYGSFKAITEPGHNGEPIKWLLDEHGHQYIDPYHIPFLPPPGRNWPFEDITSIQSPPPPRLINNKYYPLDIIKGDYKGNVIKAIYMPGLFSVRKVIIKHGRHDMSADQDGRDICDKLRWQNEIHNAIQDKVPVPKVRDFFMDEQDCYLVMDNINGKSVKEYLIATYEGKSWLVLPLGEKQQLLHKLMQILEIIHSLHNQQYIHRDITSSNFIIDRKARIWLIDMELTWSVKNQFPTPPFAFGTQGYMSPEQERGNIPTFKEDIFAIGALMLEFVTGLNPSKSGKSSKDELYKTILFFSGSEEMAELTAECLDPLPENRPSLTEIIRKTKICLEKLPQNHQKPAKAPFLNIDSLHELVQQAINNLGDPILAHQDNGWFSAKISEETANNGYQPIELDLNTGWHTGMAGPIWLISKARLAGYNITNCLIPYQNSYQYIQKKLKNRQLDNNHSLYNGLPGVRVAITEGIKAGLIDSNQHFHTLFTTSLINQPSDNLDLADGLAGELISLAKCRNFIGTNDSKRIASAIENHPTWSKINQQKRKELIYTGLDRGIAGIALALLETYQITPTPNILSMIERCLNWLISHFKNNTWHVSTQKKISNFYGTGFGVPGISLLFIRAYEHFKTPEYRKIAELALSNLPASPILNDFTLTNGMAGLGLVYLEAFRVFNNELWEDRAKWIAGILSHCHKREMDNAIYWESDTNTIVTADLFTGNGGILYFLMSYFNRQLRHPLLAT